MVRKENGGKTMKRASKIKRLLSLTLAMAFRFAVVAMPQVSAETADNPFVYVPAPNGGYVLSEVAAGEAAPRAALLSYYGIDFYHDNQFTGGSLSFTLSSESLEVVKKIGIVDFKLQKFNTDNHVWEDYIQFDDYFATNTNRFSFTKEDLRVLMHADYRLCVTFYAEKNIFSKQRVDKISNVVTIE